MQKTNEKFSDTLAAVCMGCSKFVIRESFKGPLIRKIIISVNEAVPRVKTNDDTKSCHTYVQIGKNLQLPVAVLPRVSHFMMTSQGEGFAELTYCKCELLLYSSSIPAQKCLHIVTSTMPKRWVAAATREVITIDSFRVASMTKRSSLKSHRVCMHSSGVCQKYSGDLISIVF